MDGFYHNLSRYMREHDHDNAAKVIMGELGRLMVRDRENFVTLLKFAGAPASEDGRFRVPRILGEEA